MENPDGQLVLEGTASILEIREHNHPSCGIDSRPLHGQLPQALPSDGIGDSRGGVTNAQAKDENIVINLVQNKL